MNLRIIKNIQFNEADIYIWLYIFYRLQGILYPLGIINQVLILTILIWSVVIGYRYLLITNDKTYFEKATALLLWIYIIYGLIYILFPLQFANLLPTSYVFLQNSLISLFPIFVFFQFFKQGKINDSKIKFYLIPFTILYILVYYHQQTFLLTEALNRGSEREEFTNNSGYNFIDLLPLIFLLRNRLYKYTLILITLFYIFISAKRGAILTGVLTCILGIILDFRNAKGLYNKIPLIIIGSLFIIVTTYFITNYFNNSEYLQQRLENTMDGNISGRDIIYQNVFNSYISGNLWQLLFGFGAYSTIIAAGNVAHNDWLEMIHTAGLVGLFFLFNFFYSILKSIIIIKDSLQSSIKISFILLFFVSLTKTFFSMSIQNLGFLQTILFGYLMYYVWIHSQDIKKIHNKRVMEHYRS